MIDISNNLQSVKMLIADAARKTARSASEITLVAVSKTKSESDVRDAIAAGQKSFGENRVQEATAKFSGLRAEHADLKLHLIGPLQTNKAEDAVRLFDVIETLDRPRIATALAAAVKKIGRNPECYIEINIGQEPQKAGIAPEALGEFLAFCRGCGLTVTGLMAIPPQHEDPESYFRQMKSLAEKHRLPHLSMGMSGDFEKAIACGATEVRIGTAVFGPRQA